MQAFCARLCHPIHFGRNLADQDLGLAAMVEVEGRFKSDALETGRPVGLPLFGNSLSSEISSD